jgi:hypothetical protein
MVKLVIVLLIGPFIKFDCSRYQCSNERFFLAKRNETKPNETKRNQTKRNEIFPKRNVMKKNGMKTKRVYNILIIQI